jgi:hypothetical protein
LAGVAVPLSVQAQADQDGGVMTADKPPKLTKSTTRWGRRVRVNGLAGTAGLVVAGWRVLAVVAGLWPKVRGPRKTKADLLEEMLRAAKRASLPESLDYQEGSYATGIYLRIAPGVRVRIDQERSQ